MRKHLILLLMLSVLLTACGSENLASDKAKACAKEAIEIAEKYLAYDLSCKEAIAQLDELIEDMEYVDELTDEDENKTADFYISCDLTILSSRLSLDGYGGTDETYENIQKSIESLKEAIK